MTANDLAATHSVADPALATAFRTILQDLQVDPRRLYDATALLPLVERTATPGLFLVVASDGASAYSVQAGVCNCPDAQHRDARRCKHALAVRAYQLLERAETDAEQTADAPIPYTLTARAAQVLGPDAA